MSSTVQSAHYMQHQDTTGDRYFKTGARGSNMQQATFGHAGHTDGQDNVVLATASVDFANDRMEDLIGAEDDISAGRRNDSSVVLVPQSRIPGNSALTRNDEEQTFRIGGIPSMESKMNKYPIASTISKPTLASVIKNEIPA